MTQWSDRPRYQPPPAPFQPHEEVTWQRVIGVKFTVIASTHTHTQLNGIQYAVANWELSKVRGKKKIRK